MEAYDMSSMILSIGAELEGDELIAYWKRMMTSSRCTYTYLLRGIKWTLSIQFSLRPLLG